MNYMCTFNIQGKTHSPSNWMSIRRDSNVFVMEFVNNAFLPLLVKSGGRGRFNLFLYDQPLFSAAIDAVDLVKASVSYDASNGQIEVSMTVGNMNERVGRAVIQVGVDGSIGIGAGRYLTAYSLDDIINWANELGVARPVGCGVSAEWTVGQPGFNITVDDHMIVVSFPNKLSFPVVERGGDIEVVKTWFQTQVSELTQIFVRVWKGTSDSVEFRLALVEDEMIYIADNIVLNTDGAKHGEGFIPADDILSMLYRR